MRSRLHLPKPQTMTPEQKAIYNSVLATRGNAQGPFLAWLLSPRLADPAQQLGAVCRYETSLSLLESELLILCVAAHHDCEGERLIHEPIARKAGLPEEAIVALRLGQSLPLEDNRQRLLADVAVALLARNRIPSDLYECAVTLLGERTLVEAVGIIGYYAFVAHTLNAFEMLP